MAGELDSPSRPAFERITVPVLALFGSDDPIVPVAESVEVYRAAVPADLLRIEVFPGADHRLQVGEPPRLAHGYLETVSAFVSSAVDRT
jgi:pimeloyl-ACP methyl ester carboxylesterase